MSEAEKMFEEMPERDSVSSVSGKVFPKKSILLEFKSSVSDPSGILSCWNSDNLISVPGSGSPATRILGFPRSVSLAVVAKETESEVIVSKLSIPHTWFDLQYVRPDFLMPRVIARNLIMWSRIHPKDWIQSQIPEIVANGVKGLGVDAIDIDDMGMEAFVQAYVNIVTGACVSLS